MRTLPYDQCNSTNRGCRQCGGGQYHDDLHGMCVGCGSTCALGFNRSSAAGSACGPSVSTKDLRLTSADQEHDQLLVGCARCTLPTLNTLKHVVFTSGCEYSCWRDNTAQNSSLDMYCKQALTARGNCNTSCMQCATSLTQAGQQLPTGKYIGACQDGVGHQQLPCDATKLPQGGYFAGAASVKAIGDSMGCPIGCDTNREQVDGLCLLCSTTVTTCQVNLLCLGCV